MSYQIAKISAQEEHFCEFKCINGVQRFADYRVQLIDYHLAYICKNCKNEWELNWDRAFYNEWEEPNGPQDRKES